MVTAKLKNKKILLIGGTGFIGSNLLLRLTQEGSFVEIISSSNKRPIKLFQNIDSSKVLFKKGDIREYGVVQKAIGKKDIVINLAGFGGPVDSINDPVSDLLTVSVGNLNLLEVARKQHFRGKILLFGSRQEFGKVQGKASEVTRSRPSSIYGVHRHSISHYSEIYHKHFNLQTVFIRFTNVYGPHDAKVSTSYNVVNTFIDKAIKGETLTIYGSGRQIRDYLYVDDSVDAIILAALSKKAVGEDFNLGSGRGIKFIDMAKTIVEIVKRGSIKRMRWPNNFSKVETGDFIADISKAKKFLEWKPKTSFRSGIEKTVNFQKGLMKS